MSRRAMKVSRVLTKNIRNSNQEMFDNYINRYGDTRLLKRLVNGRKVKPCGRECAEYGYLIAKEFNHASFENFTELMNDKEFVLSIASITPNPVEVDNYYYQYINEYIKKDALFRLQFLKAIYLNENVYKLDDINTIVTMCGLRKENKIILADEEFMEEFKQRIEASNYQDKLEYKCSGLDDKELHDYKVKANDLKVLFENMKQGLKEILKSFSCYVEKKEDDEQIKPVDDFWANYEPQPIRHMY